MIPQTYLKVSNYTLFITFPRPNGEMFYSKPEGAGNRSGSEDERNRISHRILTRPGTRGNTGTFMPIYSLIRTVYLSLGIAP